MSALQSKMSPFFLIYNCGIKEQVQIDIMFVLLHVSEVTMQSTLFLTVRWH